MSKFTLYALEGWGSTIVEAALAAAGLDYVIERVDPRGEGQDRQTTPADRGAVERFLTQLTQLSARSFVSDSPSSAELENWGFNRPER